MTQSTLTDGRVISLTYDVNGNITSIKPPSRPKHEFGYTDLDQAASYTPPSLGAGNTATTYSYNLDKQVTKVTRPDGKTIDMAYDAGGRVSKHTIARGATSYSYNATTGNLQTITAPDSGTVSYSYDGSLPTSETWAGSVAGNVSYVYDKDFRVTSTSVNAANPIPYQYDDDSLLTQAGNLTLSRNAQNGMLTSTSLGSVGDTISYNSFGETTAYTATAGTSNIYGEQSTRNKLGLITQKREAIGNPSVYSYTYDSAGRLTQVWLSGVLSSTYTYDSNGNRLSATVGGSSVKGTYDDQDRMLTYGNMNYAYTTNGDLQSKTSGGQTTSYEYDELGNLLSVALPNGTKITYLIDGTGRRIGKKVNGTLTQGFLYSGPLAPIAELNGSGALVSRFVYATHANVPDYMIKGGVTYRIITDHLGSPRLVINTSNGTITQRLDYDEWGNITQDTNPGFQPFGFAGGLYDRDTGLVRFGARDYDPVTGRWTTKDPIGFNGGDTNLYGYVVGDPINWVDSTGLLNLNPWQRVNPIIKILKTHKIVNQLENQAWFANYLNTVKNAKFGGSPLSHQGKNLNLVLSKAGIIGIGLTAAMIVSQLAAPAANAKSPNPSNPSCGYRSTLYRNMARIAGGLMGGEIGSQGGAVVGAFIGSFVPVPGVGTAVGAFIGGIVGGTIGYAIGEYVGESLYDASQ